MALAWMLSKWIRYKMHKVGYSKKQWAAAMLGVDQEIVDAIPSSSGEQASQSYALVPYEYDEEEGDLPETIIEPNGIYLSDTYQPSVDGMLGQTVLFCGIRRSGKSNAIAVVSEELARYNVPLLICDTEDEYSMLAHPNYMRRGVIAGSPELTELRMKHFIPIDLNGAYEFGKTILDDCLQVVLNLKSFASDNEAALIMCEIIQGMNDWEQARPNSQRIPCMALLDEANKWLPQNQAESYVNKDTLVELQKAFFGTMVRRGGKRGLGLGLATQRIVELDKRALQTTWKFLFQQSEQNDIERYKALGLDGDEVQALRRGECFVFSPGVIGFRMRMRVRNSPHLAHTPGLEQLLAHSRRNRSMELVTARSFVGVEQVPMAEPYARPVTVEQPMTEPTRARPQTKLDRALNAWNAGHKSVRSLAAALSIEGEQVSTDEAYRLICQLDARNLIVRKKRTS